ncbi:MAG: hypothetical protein SGBAC_001543 [Bacillariaceae sp.]
MAKQALQKVLEDTIGKYVQGLDAESLNVAIFAGKIELNSLELDVDAVNLELDRQAEDAPNLALPFKIVSGGFSSFNVEVPWVHLASSPVIFRLSGLNIVVEPFTREAPADNESVSMAQVQKQRQKSIKSSNEYREQTNTVKKLAGADSDAPNHSTFGSRLVRRIIENIQVEISDVHISLAGKEGSAGVVLESLSLVTTEKDGTRTFVDRTKGSEAENVFLYKALELKGFGVYLDERVPGEQPSHSFILSPLSFEANLRQADGNVCIDYSKYQLSSELSTVAIEVSRNQLEVAEKISQGIVLNDSGPTPLFPEYRPVARISSENAHEWWRYAKRCIGRMNGRRSWAEFFLAFKKRKTYIELYKRHVHSEACSWLQPLSESEEAALAKIENDRTVPVKALMLWRDLADAQVELKQSKQQANKEKRKKFFSFASKSKEENDGKPDDLTVEELKELEDLAQQSFADDELSKDSKLCDTSFVLKSLNIVLTSYNSRQIAALNMGEVELGLNARADGAFAFNFDMHYLNIQDLATPDSLFPNILRNLPYDSSETAEKKNAVHLQISKSKTGDQNLQLRISEFEAVASKPFFKELMQFATPTPTTSTKQGNTISSKSAAGSVDDISNVLVDAWKAKTETNVSWAMELDIDAPIIMVPENCKDKQANILVLDLGRLHLQYGQFSPTENVEQWFRDNKADHQSGVSYESGYLATSDLTFKVATASDWLEDRSTTASIPGSDIIEPISAKLNFGIEQSHNPLDPPRICCIGVIPSITLLFSPAQGKKLFPVVKALGEFADEMSNESEIPTEVTDSTVPTALDEGVQEQDSADNTVQDPSKTDEDCLATFFFKIGLQRLSTTLTLDENNRLEAQLVSVYASTVVRSNGSSSSSLQMGWFWVLDLLECDITRKQRLLAHSKLPKDPSVFAEGDKYDMLGHLVDQGVFEEDYTGSTDLADISYQMLVSEGGKERMGDNIEQMLDVRFSSLFVHFNPQSLKGMMLMVESFSSILDDVDPIKPPVSQNTSSPSDDVKQQQDDGPTDGKLLIKLKVESLDICLNSPRDDLPLFVLAVSEGDLKVISGPNDLSCLVSLKSMTFEDIRPEALHRQHRHLIDQGALETSADGGHLFVIDYFAGVNSTRAELAIATTQIVLIPDAVSELVKFFPKEDKIEKDPSLSSAKLGYGSQLVDGTAVYVSSSGGNENVETGIAADTMPSVFHKSTFTVKTQVCRIVLVDLGSELSNEKRSGSQPSQLAESVVLQGIFDATLTMDADSETSEMINAGVQAQAEAMEVFSAFGKEMLSPLQILDPTKGALHISMEKNADGGTEVDLRAVATADLEFFLSMHNAALLDSIVTSLSSSFAVNETGSGDSQLHELSGNEAKRIEQLSSALEQADNKSAMRNQSGPIDQPGNDETPSGIVQADVEMKIANKIQAQLTIAQIRVTVVNDLQGLDEALFRFSVANLVAGSEVVVPIGPNTMEQMTVDFHMNASIVADYFDSSINLWSNLLIKPWEVNIKVSRSSNSRFESPRLSSTIDVESFPCHVSLSPEFLMSLSSATRMWSIYSIATSKSLITSGEKGENSDENVKTNIVAASAARNLLLSLPYAVENHCGCDVAFSLAHGNISRRECPTGSIQFFRFQAPKGKGHGGKRMYGQDVDFEKSVTLLVGDQEIVIPHLDSMLGSRKYVHNLSDGRALVTFVVREGKTTVLHLTSNVNIFNHSSIPFDISIGMDDPKSIGTCMARNEHKPNSALTTIDGVATKQSKSFSVPMDLLTKFTKEWTDAGQSSVFLRLSPSLKSGASEVLSGGLDIASHFGELSKSKKNHHVCRFDVTCQPTTRDRMDPFVVQLFLKATLIDYRTINIDVFLEPRAVIENLFPIDIKIRSKMPHMFTSAAQESTLDGDGAHDLQPGDRVEVFTTGPSVAIAIKPKDAPNSGCALEWKDLDLPIDSESRLPEPLSSFFPLAGSKQRKSEFFIAEGYKCLDQLSEREADESPKKSELRPVVHGVSLADPLRSFSVTLCCFGVDHTGEMLFELVPSRDERIYGTDRNQYHPFGAFSSGGDSNRLTMLPRANSALRLLQQMKEGEAAYKATLPFMMDDLVIGEGGVNASPILWENRKRSGYCAYRRLVNEYQSEIHIVPEFVVFNGSAEAVIISERGMGDITIAAGKFAPLKCGSRLGGLELALNYFNEECTTKYIRVDELGVKVEFVNSTAGKPVGSVCVQTALDTYGNARLVVKIGEITRGPKKANESSIIPSVLADDFIRFRVRWTELQLVLNESREKHNAGGPPSQTLSSPTHTEADGPKIAEADSLMSVNFSGLSVDIQRVFKEVKEKEPKAENKASTISSPERCQVAMIVHKLQVTDHTPASPFPIVFDSSSDANFIDFCARTRGPMDANIMNVDLLDLSLAHSQGKSQRIQLTTSEDYLWKIVDLMTRISDAGKEVGSYNVVLTEDEDNGGYIARIEDCDDHCDTGPMYTPPQVDQLYDIDMARVSPFALLVSFKRTPDESRYEKARNVRGAALTNYFTRKLKFSIDKAELKFGKYENKKMKGQLDQLMESLGAVYASRMKFKVLTLLSSASLQDWKFLAAREGNDAYVEGDELRATGNLAGMAAGALLGTVGRGLGGGVSGVTRTLGNGIEDVTGLVGARRLGAGVNLVVSGAGDGIGNTLTGVGGGAGKVIHGAGQGVGQVVGGVLGGAFQMGKGIGNGIVKGDGRGLVNDVGKGAGQIGSGVFNGTGSVLKGATGGVLQAGKGLFQIGGKKKHNHKK